jgi:ubiquinone/menaquinone biosynthesis C-methylase UbiE
MAKKPGTERNREPLDVLKDQIRSRLLKYTEKAFLMMPEMDKPKILDIGCGSGIPTLELARLGQGEVIGIDIDQTVLDKFIGKIAAAGINKRVKVFKCSLFDISFTEESFDVIWAEGAIHTIGFERGRRE